MEEELYVNINGKKVSLKKLPCYDCEYRYSYICPQCKWNKDGKYNTYCSYEESIKLEEEEEKENKNEARKI